MMSYVNTGAMTVVYVKDPNAEDGARMVDLGNKYYRNTETGEEVVIFKSKEDAKKWAHHFDMPVYHKNGEIKCTN